MSRLDELIKELCPDGVEYRTFGESAKIVRGASPRPIKNFITTEPTGVNWIKIGDVKPGDKYISVSAEKITLEGAKKSRAVKKGDFILSNSMSFGRPYILQIDGCIHDGWLAISDFSDSYLSDFLYHLLNSNSCQSEMQKKASFGGAVQNLNADIVRALVLPVPPLEVQHEIVHILDSFTLLTAELTAELTARKKQYEFYRNKLLTFDNNVKIVPLADIADIGTGSSNTNEGLEEGKYPFYVRSQEPLRKNEYEYDETAIITAGDGVGVGKVFHYVEGKYALHQRAYRIHINTPDVLPRYYFHYMRSAFLPYIQKTMFQGSVASIRRPMLNQFPVPVPTLDVQKRLVNVLDNFEAICTDLNIGLPAEIEARQKQYEYYRDLLLTFAETGSTLVTDRQTDRQTELSAIKLIQYVFGYAPVRLELIAKISRGGNFQKKDFVASGRPCIHYGQMYTYFGIHTDKTLTFVNDEIFEKSKTAKSGDIIMAVTSENVEDVCLCTAWLGSEEVAVSGHTAIISHNQNAKFMSYYFHSSDFFSQKKKLAHGTKVIEVTPNKLNDIIIMLPSIEKQEKIVSILDRFDTLCNDLSAGLPAEIEARQKQYEYYRDKLLSFKELPK